MRGCHTTLHPCRYSPGLRKGDWPSEPPQHKWGFKTGSPIYYPDTLNHYITVILTNTLNRQKFAKRYHQVKVRHYQQNSKVFQHTVHHIFLWQMLELVDEIDHVFTHWRTIYSIHKPAILKPCIFRLRGKTKRKVQNYNE